VERNRIEIYRFLSYHPRYGIEIRCNMLHNLRFIVFVLLKTSIFVKQAKELKR
jgi:hypothetical protein